MSRIAVIFCFAAVLTCCSPLTTNNIDWEHARLACADVGIAPGSSVFDQCVSTLYNTLWAEQNTGER
jgi:hypothetical protein